MTVIFLSFMILNAFTARVFFGILTGFLVITFFIKILFKFSALFFDEVLISPSVKIPLVDFFIFVINTPSFFELIVFNASFNI